MNKQKHKYKLNWVLRKSKDEWALYFENTNFICTCKNELCILPQITLDIFCSICLFYISKLTWENIYVDAASVQFSWVAQSCELFVTPWTAARQASLCITNSRSLLKLISIESVMSPNHLILCHPLLLTPLIFPSIRVFSNEVALCIRWPKYWSFSFNIRPSNEHSGLVSFRMDGLDLLAVQGTLKSLLHHHNSKV